MKKQPLIDKIQQIKELTDEERALLTALVQNKKKYGLVWEEKPEAVEQLLREQIPVLQEVKARTVIAPPAPNLPTQTPQNQLFETTHSPNHSLTHSLSNHTLIEGDNLHALTALSFTHAGKVDVIYIDPPYNTGKANEFRYNDKWILKDNGFRHSFWIDFMQKRLKIAKKLLSETGVMIIHIDENEFDALNVVLETEIFDAENFLGVIVWNKQNPKGDAKGVANMHEYILIYAKNKQAFVQMPECLKRPKPNVLNILSKAKRIFSKMGKIDLPQEVKDIVKPFNYPKEILKPFEVKYDLELINKEFQVWLERQDFSGGEKAYKFIDEEGRVYRGVSMAWPNKEQAPDDYFIPLIHPKTQKTCPVPERGWRNSKATMQKLLEAGLILFGQDETKQPERKYFLEENLMENTPSIYNCGASDDALFKNLGIAFPYPKPLEVAKYFLKSIYTRPSIILDFFAGSGTTMHAVMQLNAEDGGNRQCILITNNENNICEEVTYERNKRVIEGYTNAKGEPIAGLSGNALRYYKCDFVERKPSAENKRNLVLAATELLCLREDCHIEQLTDYEAIRLFVENEKAFLVVYEEDAIEDAVAVIEELDIKLVRVYVFSHNAYDYADDFAEVAGKIQLCALPDAIYQAYKQVLPPTDYTPLPTLEESSPEEINQEAKRKADEEILRTLGLL